MPYRATQFVAGEHYHVFNRGNNREPIFFGRDNYAYFLKQIRRHLIDQGVEIVGYCLMPNHYHLIVKLASDNLSELMQSFALSYTKAINKQRRRVGSLFQGPFKSVIIDRDDYLLHLSRYIHRNPVEAGMVAKAEEWEFSSYQDYLGLRSGTLPKPEVVLSQFGSREDYRKFVESYSKKDKAVIESLLFD